MSRWGHLVLACLVLLGAWHEGVHVFEHAVAAPCSASEHGHAHDEPSSLAESLAQSKFSAVGHTELHCAACYLPWSPATDSSRVGVFEALQRTCSWPALPGVVVAALRGGIPPLRGPPVA